MDAFVKVRDLRKRFGDLAAVDGVSFEVGEGHTLALLGPSGCGKTTILRSIAGLETPEHGSIEIGGRVVFDGALAHQSAAGRARARHRVPILCGVAAHVGCGQCRLSAQGSGSGKGGARRRASTGFWKSSDSSAARDKPAPELSGGQQQRVALARALVHEPRLVLFDEPLSNLDAQLRDQMRLELKVLQDRLRFTAIYVTHDQAEAFALAESVVVMNRGRIETIGSPREVFRRPRTPFVARFLGLNVWPGTLLGPTSDGPDGQRYAQVALADGFSLWGVIDDDQAVTAGAPVVACLRKEHMDVRPLAADRPKSASGSALSEGQTFAGEVRAASFLGLEEELMIVIAGVELRAVRPASGVGTGDAVEVSIRPQDCLIFRATAGRLDE